MKPTRSRTVKMPPTLPAKKWAKAIDHAVNVIAVSDAPTQVERYLTRLRQTVPFPCTMEEAYFGCVPDVVYRMYKDGYFEEEGPPPGKMSNLVSTMFATYEKQSVITRQGILHIAPLSEEDYRQVQVGSGGYEYVFWIRAPRHCPTPRNSNTHPFFLPNDHKFSKQIREWVDKAYHLESEIERAVNLVNAFSEVADTPTKVKVAWPELLHFVTFQQGFGQALNRATRIIVTQEALKAAPQEHRAKVLEMLSTSVLLKEEVEANAWVKFYSEIMV